LRFSQAIVRSTTHRRFRSSNPLAPTGRLTISRVRRPIRARAVAVLDVGGVDTGADEQAAGVGCNVALAALDLLSRATPLGSPL